MQQKSSLSWKSATPNQHFSSQQQPQRGMFYRLNTVSSLENSVFALALKSSPLVAELEKRVRRVFPDAEVKVKPMVTNSSINTDASKGDKAKLAAVIEEMFEDADMWLVNDI